MSELTRETPAPGVVVYQPRHGFRYAVDAFWLVGFALEESHTPLRSALDLGTGSGIMALLLAARGLEVLGLDVNPNWQPGWARSLAECRYPASLRQGDVLGYDGPMVDLVLCNPPYASAASGPISPNPDKALARSESSATLTDFAACAARHLAPAGVACFIIPSSREAELMAGPLHVHRLVRVGKKRSLMALRHEPREAKVEQYNEEDEQVLGWIRLARAQNP